MQCKAAWMTALHLVETLKDDRNAAGFFWVGKINLDKAGPGSDLRRVMSSVGGWVDRRSQFAKWEIV